VAHQLVVRMDSHLLASIGRLRLWMCVHYLLYKQSFDEFFDCQLDPNPPKIVTEAPQAEENASYLVYVGVFLATVAVGVVIILLWRSFYPRNSFVLHGRRGNFEDYSTLRVIGKRSTKQKKKKTKTPKKKNEVRSKSQSSKKDQGATSTPRKKAHSTTDTKKDQGVTTPTAKKG